MDESLRRAYLAAMDVPLWLPRAEAEAEAEALAAGPGGCEPALPAPVVSRPVPEGAASRGGGGSARAQALLDAAPPAPAPRTAAVASRAARAPKGAGERLALRFVWAGSTLFVDEVAGHPDGRAEDLYRALSFVLERAQQQPRLQDFDWPPDGVAWDAAEARDAVLGRIRKITEGAVLRRLVLMGPAPARLLLGWSEEDFARRAAAMQRLEVLDCPVLVTPAADELVREPALKRLAWKTLRLATPADG